MKTGYIHIDSACFTDMHLTPTEAVLYSLVKGYCAHGQKFERKIEEIALQVNMSPRGVRKAFDRLVDGGYLTKDRKQFGMEYQLSSEWKVRSAQSAYQDRNKVPRRSAQSAEQDRNKVPITPYIINNNNNSNKAEEGSFYGVTLEVFVEHFKLTHGGREYTPNFMTMSNAANNIMDNIKISMTNDKYVCDIDTFRSYFSQWIQLAWQKTDDWHRERWSMEFLNSQFNYFNNLINSKNGNQSSTGSNQQQRGAGVSDEYIIKQFDKIARSRATRAEGGGDPTASR